jgi:hypothetical protein
MFNVRWFAVAVVVLAVTGCVAAPIQHTMPGGQRGIAGGRGQIVTVAQSEIGAGIQPSTISAATGGGLLIALVDAGINNARAKTAEAAIVPVRDALTDFYFEQRAMAASEALAERTPWLGVTRTELNKDPSNASFSKALDASPNPQTLTTTYSYLLDQNFRVAKLSVTVALIKKALPKNGKPEHRALLANAVFARTFVFVVPLRNPTEEMDQNAVLWAKDGGKPIEESLNKALQKALVVIQKALEQSEAQEKKVQAGKVERLYGGYAGKVIETDADGTLVLGGLGEWIYVFRA